LSAERSKTVISTELSRGTPSYRAPELLAEHPTFSDESDIWALGCILFELAAKRKAFSSDWEVHDYAVTRRKPPVPLRDSITSELRAPLVYLIHEMLCVKFKDRPKAQELCRVFGVLTRPGSDSISNFEEDLPLLAEIYPASVNGDNHEPESSEQESSW
jgi:serine/threonine protein kinase